MANRNTAATAVQGTTGVAGAALSFIPGIGPLIGGLVAGAGQLAGLGIRAGGDDPTVLGATGAQKSSLATQSRNVAAIENRQGQTAADVQRRYQAADMGQAQTMQAMNLLSSQSMSAFEREALVKTFLATMQKKQKDVETQLAEFDARSEAQKQRDLAQAAEAESRAADRIRAAEFQKQEMEKQYEITKWTNFASQVGTATQAMATGANQSLKYYQENKEVDLDKWSNEEGWKVAEQKKAGIPDDFRFENAEPTAWDVANMREKVTGSIVDMEDDAEFDALKSQYESDDDKLLSFNLEKIMGIELTEEEKLLSFDLDKTMGN